MANQLAVDQSVDSDLIWAISPGHTSSFGRLVMFEKVFILASLIKPAEFSATNMDSFFQMERAPGELVDTSFIESESMATDIRSLENFDVSENSIVEMGNRDRILCTHISSGRSTRYMLMDATRLILVSPDMTKPGFGIVKFFIELRRVQRISVDKTDERILNLIVPGDPAPILLGFEDVKRSFLALTHLETRRIDIRRKIFEKIKKYISSYNH